MVCFEGKEIFFKLKDRDNKKEQKSHNWLVWLITAMDGEAGGPTGGVGDFLVMAGVVGEGGGSTFALL